MSTSAILEFSVGHGGLQARSCCCCWAFAGRALDCSQKKIATSYPSLHSLPPITNKIWFVSKIRDDPPKKIHQKCWIGAGFKKGRFFSDDGLRVQKIDGVWALFEGVTAEESAQINPSMNCAMFCLNDRHTIFFAKQQHCSSWMLKHHWSCVTGHFHHLSSVHPSPWSSQPVLGILGSNQCSKTTVGSTNAKSQAMWLMLVV